MEEVPWPRVSEALVHLQTASSPPQPDVPVQHSTVQTELLGSKAQLDLADSHLTQGDDVTCTLCSVCHLVQTWSSPILARSLKLEARTSRSTICLPSPFLSSPTSLPSSRSLQFLHLRRLGLDRPIESLAMGEMLTSCSWDVIGISGSRLCFFESICCQSLR